MELEGLNQENGEPGDETGRTFSWIDDRRGYLSPIFLKRWLWGGFFDGIGWKWRHVPGILRILGCDGFPGSHDTSEKICRKERRRNVIFDELLSFFSVLWYFIWKKSWEYNVTQENRYLWSSVSLESIYMLKIILLTHYKVLNLV